MKIIKSIISILGYEVIKDKKVYTEDRLKQFARSALISAFILPIVTFNYASKAKRSTDEKIIRRAKIAELIAILILSLPVFVILVTILVFYL